MFYIKIQLITDNFLLEKGTQKILNHLLEIKLNNYSKNRNLKFYYPFYNGKNPFKKLLNYLSESFSC